MEYSILKKYVDLFLIVKEKNISWKIFEFFVILRIPLGSFLWAFKSSKNSLQKLISSANFHASIHKFPIENPPMKINMSIPIWNGNNFMRMFNNIFLQIYDDKKFIGIHSKFLMISSFFSERVLVGLWIFREKSIVVLSAIDSLVFTTTICLF